MKRFNLRKILVPVDFSDTSMYALEQAVWIAKKWDAEITLLHVVETMNFTSALNYLGIGNNNDVLEAEIENKMQELTQTLRAETGAQIVAMSVRGRIYEQINEAVTENKIDLVIMGTHGTSGIKDYTSGTNTWMVVTHTDCPVISIKSPIKNQSFEGFKNIVMLLDHAITSRNKIPYVAQLALHCGATVHIAGLEISDDEKMMFKMKVIVKQAGEFFTHHQIPFTSEIITGNDSAELLLGFAHGRNADLIAIMRENEFKETGMLINPFAQQVINHSRIPVLSIRSSKKYESFEPKISY